LQAVLQVAQKLVGRGQARVFGIGEQPLVAQAEQRKHGAAVPHPRLAAAVQALQALHQKLDVADAAGRQLDIQPAPARFFAAIFSLMRWRVSDTASTARKSSELW
jgi:hypothetical protein